MRAVGRHVESADRVCGLHAEISIFYFFFYKYCRKQGKCFFFFLFYPLLFLILLVTDLSGTRGISQVERNLECSILPV